MKKTFTAYNATGRLTRTVYEVGECTAVNPETGAKQNALEIVTTRGRMTTKKMVFGYEMPATLSECLTLASI